MPPDPLEWKIRKILGRSKMCSFEFENALYEFRIIKGNPYGWQLLEDGVQIRDGIATSVMELVNIYREMGIELDE